MQKKKKKVTRNICYYYYYIYPSINSYFKNIQFLKPLESQNKSYSQFMLQNYF